MYRMYIVFFNECLCLRLASRVVRLLCTEREGGGGGGENQQHTNNTPTTHKHINTLHRWIPFALSFSDSQIV